MRQIWALALHDLRLLFTERGAVAIRLVMPIVFIVVVGIANDAFQSEEPPPPSVMIVDHDDSDLSSSFVSILSDDLREGGARLALAPAGDDAGGEEEVRARLEAAQAQVAIAVPHGFAAALLAGEGATVRLLFGANDPQLASRLSPAVEAAARRVQAAARAGDAARTLTDAVHAEEAARAAVDRGRELVAADRVEISPESIDLPDRHVLVGFQQSVPGMGSMFVMLSVLAGASLLVEDRARWTLQRTLCAPVSHGSFVAGKMLGRFLIGIAQYAVAIVTGLVIGALFDTGFGSSPALFAAVMVAFVLAMSGVSVLLATLVAREQQASGWTTLLAVTLAPLGGAWWSLDIEIIPDVMRRIAFASPFYWVMEGFRAAIHDLGLAAAAGPLAVLLAIAAAAGLAATVRLRR